MKQRFVRDVPGNKTSCGGVTACVLTNVMSISLCEKATKLVPASALPNIFPQSMHIQGVVLKPAAPICQTS